MPNALTTEAEGRICRGGLSTLCRRSARWFRAHLAFGLSRQLLGPTLEHVTDDWSRRPDTAAWGSPSPRSRSAKRSARPADGSNCSTHQLKRR